MTPQLSIFKILRTDPVCHQILMSNSQDNALGKDTQTRVDVLSAPEPELKTSFPQFNRLPLEIHF
jgi:hypothetical protein